MKRKVDFSSQSWNVLNANSGMVIDGRVTVEEYIWNKTVIQTMIYVAKKPSNGASLYLNSSECLEPLRQVWKVEEKRSKSDKSANIF